MKVIFNNNVEVKPRVPQIINSDVLVVYTISGKDRLYKNICMNSISSLITLGKYKGDITILTDEYHNWDDCNFPRCKIEKCINASIHPVIQRCYIPLYIDIKKYAYICYLDSDILVVSDIQPLFGDSEHLLYAEEKRTIGDVGSDKINTLFMTNDEKRLWKSHYTINAGQFVVPNKLYDLLFSTWQQTLGGKNAFGVDQASLNLIIRRGIIPALPFSNNQVCFRDYAPKTNDGVILNHWNCRYRTSEYKALASYLLCGKSFT